MQNAHSPATTGRARVRVDELTWHEGAGTPVREVTMKLRDGECIALIGPPGSGKSELLGAIGAKLAGGCRGRLEGKVSLDGRDLLAEGPARPGQIAWVAGPGLRLEGSVHACIAAGLRAAGQAPNEEALDAIVVSSLRRAGLWPELRGRLQSFGTDLSYGQQRRLALAAALGQRPEIILFNEPFAGDADEEADLMLEALTALRGRLTLVFSSADVARARAIADRVGFMQAGRLLEMGETRQVFAAPRTPACGAFISRQQGMR